MDDAHAIGLMANVSRESGFRPGVVSGDDGGAGGLFQWKIPRSNNMSKAVPDWKTNWKSQIDYALKEPGEPGPQWQGMKFSSSQEAADWWMSEWERPGDKIEGSRKHKEYIASLEKYKSKTGKGYDLPSGNLGTQSGSLSEAKSLAESMKVPLFSHVRKDNPNSYHYDGRAMDFSNDGVGNGTPEQLALAKELVKRYGATAKEIFYTPLGFSIKDGKKVSPIAASGHYNHVHVAFAKGGRVLKPTLATLAEDGREEFVFDADTTAGLDSMTPKLLDRLNLAETKPQLMNVLQSYFRGNTQIAATYGGMIKKPPQDTQIAATYGGMIKKPPQDNQIAATYGGAAAEKQQKIDAFMNQKGMPAGKGFQGRFDMFGREYDTNTGKLKQSSNKPSQDTQIAATYGEGFPKKNFMDFLEKDYQKNLKNPIKNNTNDDSRPSRVNALPLAQKSLSSPQISSYASYEQSYPSEVFIPIPIPVPIGGGGNSSGSSGGTIIAMGGGSNPFDSLYKGG